MSAAPEPMSEQVWQQQFVQLAGYLGWKHLHVRRSLGRGRKWVTATNIDGWPDLHLWHETTQRTIYVELKSEAGRLRPQQIDVLGSLTRAGQEVYVLKPSDLELAKRILSGERIAITASPRVHGNGEQR